MVSLASPAAAMLPPAPPPKRPALNLKRNSSYMETEDGTGVSTPTKKMRVAFDPNVDVRIMDDWTDKSFELVKEEVRQGIERHIAPPEQRDDTQYTKLVQLLAQDAFSSDAPTSKLLKKYVLAIDAKISSLGECGRLVSAVLDLSWLGRDEEFVGLYARFMCDLASANGKFIPAITERLVSCFAKLPASFGRLPEETPISRSRMFTRLHLVIKTLLRQIPSASSSLLKTLKSEFPNDLATTRSYLQHQKNLLRLAEQTPELKSEILSLVVQRLVGIDVQIQQDIQDFEDDAEDKLLQRPSSKDGDGNETDESDDESVSESEETMTQEEQRLRELRLKIAKMDGTIDALFEFYAPRIEDGSSPKSNTGFQQLLSHFMAFILPNRTRHSQFLIFHFSQTSPAHMNAFAERCLYTALEEQRPAAAAYISSFLARGAHLPTNFVREIFKALCDTLDSMRSRYEPTCRGPERRAYAFYYTVAQSLLYIFCFRWRDLVVGSTTTDIDDEDFNAEEILDEGGELEWLSGIKEVLTRNVYSKLNPLKVCSQEIVGEFAKITNYLRFLYVIPLLETNKRVRLGQTFSYYGTGGVIDIGRRETVLDRKRGEAHHQLEAYFPFDPFHLPKSKRWVSKDYNEWKLPKGLNDDDDDDDDDGEEDGESEAEEESEDESLQGANDLPVPSVVSVGM